MDAEGLYRVAGFHDDVEAIKMCFDKGRFPLVLNSFFSFFFLEGRSSNLVFLNIFRTTPGLLGPRGLHLTCKLPGLPTVPYLTVQNGTQNVPYF